MRQYKLWFVLFFFITVMFTLQYVQSINRYIQSTHTGTFPAALDPTFDEKTGTQNEENKLTQEQQIILNQIKEGAKKC